jgi:hypothetical protein
MATSQTSERSVKTRRGCGPRNPGASPPHTLARSRGTATPPPRQPTVYLPVSLAVPDGFMAYATEPDLELDILGPERVAAALGYMPVRDDHDRGRIACYVGSAHSLQKRSGPWHGCFSRRQVSFNRTTSSASSRRPSRRNGSPTSHGTCSSTRASKSPSVWRSLPLARRSNRRNHRNRPLLPRPDDPGQHVADTRKKQRDSATAHDVLVAPDGLNAMLQLAREAGNPTPSRERGASVCPLLLDFAPG